jgi:hypothetical protein
MKMTVFRWIHLKLTSEDTTSYQRKVTTSWVSEMYNLSREILLYCCECHLSHSNSNNSSSTLLDNKTSTVADSEDDRLIDHY